MRCQTVQTVGQQVCQVHEMGWHLHADMKASMSMYVCVCTRDTQVKSVR